MPPPQEPQEREWTAEEIEWMEEEIAELRAEVAGTRYESLTDDDLGRFVIQGEQRRRCQFASQLRLSAFALVDAVEHRRAVQPKCNAVHFLFG